MDFLKDISSLNETGLYFTLLTVILLIIIFVLYKTYRASLSVEARLREFSSLSSSDLGKRLSIIEVSSNAYHLNKEALGPLAKIIDSYCVITTDRNGIISYANEKYLALARRDIHDVIGKRHGLLLCADGDCRDDHALSSDRAWHGEIQGRTRTGAAFWLDAFVFPLSFITDIDEGFMYFGTDISAIKKQNNKLIDEVRKHEETLSKVEHILLHSEKMASLGTISAGIAHEINNPIAFVAGNIKRFENYISLVSGAMLRFRKRLGNEKFSQLLRASSIDEKNARELDFVLEDYASLISETQDGIDRVQRIIRDLKCFSHGDHTDFQPLDIHACIETSLNLAKHELKNRIRIVRDFDDQMPMIEGSEGQLSQVFVNLMVNAAQAIEKDGEIRIKTRLTEAGSHIEISDNGPGIPAEHLATIFEPFYTTKPAGQGTGLGLSISQDIIKRHRGNIDVQSAPGQGCTFVIDLPTAQNARHHAA